MNNYTRVPVIVSIVLLTVNLLAQAFEGKKGDVNNDGNINVLDVVKTVRSILGLDTLDEEEVWFADCNSFGVDCRGDGKVDILDVTKIVNLILRIVQCTKTTVTDIDGNVYYTVRIGEQEWMAENLKVTHYRNGDAIPNVTSNSGWRNRITGAYCNYDNDPNNVATYGCLYNWYAVDDNRNIAPEGWHVPSDEEWKQLELYLGMSQSEADDTKWRGKDEGGKMKTTGTIEGGDGLWYSPNAGATNESGFSALTSGYRYYSDGSFSHLGYTAHFWSSTVSNSNSAWLRALHYDDLRVYRGSYYRNYGFSVRCIED